MADEISVLLRYRDLIAETIRAHDAIVKESGACFWGWWKRPTEGARADVWDDLERQLKEKGKVAVGLFDSGESDGAKTVHRAWVTEVRKPPAGAGKHWEPIPLTEEELRLVPEYYRSSPFSRAWLKIVRFDGPLDFFGRYSYLEAPPLPGISDADLGKLRGKVVVDGDELRAMDTTVWRVRPRQEGDSVDRFLSSSTRLVLAVTPEPVRVPGKLILHLSDLHFATGTHRESQHRWKYPSEKRNVPSLAEAVMDSVSAEDVGALLITGDFTFLAHPDEFEHARQALNTMMGRFDLSTDHVVIIPGNHDIKWTKDPAERYEHKAPVDVAPEEAKDAFRAFYRDLLRHDPHEHLAMGRRLLFDSGVVVDLVALNSSALEAGKNYLAGMGHLGARAFRTVRREMGWETSGGVINPSSALRVLALHHHLLGAEDVENPDEYYSGFGSAVDARGILRSAARCGVSLAVHGHRHRPFVWRSEVYPLPERDHDPSCLGTVSILGGGSAGSRESEAGKNFFNTIEPKPDHLVVTTYCANNDDDAFRQLSSFVALLRFDKDRLGLGPWTVPGT